MRNYGEELGYWYWRLNGFFPIVDFVLHRGPDRIGTSDADILAVRPKWCDERIGGSDDMDAWIRPFASQQLGIICQIKTGGMGSGDLFPENSLRDAVRRLGFQEDVESIVHQFRGNESADTDTGPILKVLISTTARPVGHPTHVLSLDHVREFIRERMRRYEEKRSDRHFFPSPLLQYIIHFDA